MRPPRSRLLQAALVAATIAAGLGSRRFAGALPHWAAKDLGDALYATMSFFLAGLLAPRVKTAPLAAGALAYCWAIEFSQALHVGWLDAIRATRLGALVLGQGFHALDLLDYVLGVALGAGVELAITRARARSA